jgi:SHAQKYF class myb-like DNA-binding protein
MESVLNIENKNISCSVATSESRKERIGRWSPSETYLFESLLERHGKNWKKIHEHMKGRTLSQIRSHGQKHFDKIGSKKVEEFARRAKLLEAYETL